MLIYMRNHEQTWAYTWLNSFDPVLSLNPEDLSSKTDRLVVVPGWYTEYSAAFFESSDYRWEEMDELQNKTPSVYDDNWERQDC